MRYLDLGIAYSVSMIIGMSTVICFSKSPENIVEPISAPTISKSIKDLINPDCDKLRKDNLTCLACNIYHEARGETDAGQIMVAKVTMNRVEHSHKNVCEIVWADKQFSWTHQ